MSPTGRRAVRATVGAIDSLLGHVTGHSRADVAKPYLVRVSDRAWADLGEDGPGQQPPVEAASRHPIVRKFFDQFSEPARVDTGVPLGAVNDPKVFRIRMGDWRAAVRYIPEDGVVWLCRVVSLATFSQEASAYDEFGKMHRAGTLLPAQGERRLARGDQFILAAIEALRVARVNADNEPGEWWPAQATRPDASTHPVGRIYAEREVVPDEGEYVTRFVLVISTPPPDVQLPKDWLKLVLGSIFSTEEPVERTYDLPHGTNLRKGEVPFKQETVELIDEEEQDAEW